VWYFTDAQAVHGHVTVLLPEDLPGLADILGVLGGQGAVVGDRGFHRSCVARFLGQMIQVDGRAGLRRWWSDPRERWPHSGPGPASHVRRNAGCSSPLDLDHDNQRSSSRWPGEGRDAAVGQHITEPALAGADCGGPSPAKPRRFQSAARGLSVFLRPDDPQFH